MYTINAKYDNILKNRHRNSDQIFIGGWVLCYSIQEKQFVKVVESLKKTEPEGIN